MKKLLVLFLLFLIGCFPKIKKDDCLVWKNSSIGGKWYKVLEISTIDSKYSLLVQDVETSKTVLLVTTEEELSNEFMQVDCNLLNKAMKKGE